MELAMKWETVLSGAFCTLSTMPVYHSLEGGNVAELTCGSYIWNIYFYLVPAFPLENTVKKLLTF